LLSYLRLVYYLLRPGTIFVRRGSNGLGDSVMLSALLPFLRAGNPNRRIVIESPWKDLFRHNPHVDWATDRHLKTTKRHIRPSYRVRKRGDRPLLEQLMRCIGAGGPAVPRVYLTQDEIDAARRRYAGCYIAVCPASKKDFSANRKEWGLERFQELRDRLSEYDFVQIGVPDDPLLDNVTDARGLPVRQSAAVIQNAWFFLGLEGGLMHLAKAVGTRSVIIYGGYVRPEVSAYSENLNIHSDVECSPCYDSHMPQKPCDSMICMRAIEPGMVYDRIKEEFIDTEERVRR
jgi:ADP-heptose:LPS heptosyltransferase